MVNRTIETGHRRRAGPCPGAGLLGGLMLLMAGPAWAGSVDLPNGHGRVSVPVESMKELKFRSVVRQQYDFSCGSAALATLLTYHYERPVSELAVFKAMFEKGDKARIRKEGFSMLDMKRYLESRGFQADGFRVPLDKLKQVGVPAIVLTNDGGYSHFVVVKGVEDGRVLLGDPAKGLRTMERAKFERMWNGLVVVVRNRTRVAREHFNRSEEWRVRAQAPVRSGVRRWGLSEFTRSLPRRSDF